MSESPKDYTVAELSAMTGLGAHVFGRLIDCGRISLVGPPRPVRRIPASELPILRMELVRKGFDVSSLPTVMS